MDLGTCAEPSFASCAALSSCFSFFFFPLSLHDIGRRLGKMREIFALEADHREFVESQILLFPGQSTTRRHESMARFLDKRLGPSLPTFFFPFFFFFFPLPSSLLHRRDAAHRRERPIESPRAKNLLQPREWSEHGQKRRPTKGSPSRAMPLPFLFSSPVLVVPAALSGNGGRRRQVGPPLMLKAALFFFFFWFARWFSLWARRSWRSLFPPCMVNVVQTGAPSSRLPPRLFSFFFLSFGCCDRFFGKDGPCGTSGSGALLFFSRRAPFRNAARNSQRGGQASPRRPSGFSSFLLPRSDMSV